MRVDYALTASQTAPGAKFGPSSSARMPDDEDLYGGSAGPNEALHGANSGTHTRRPTTGGASGEVRVDVSIRSSSIYLLTASSVDIA